jgi:sugar phosphate isomerase/epimerase
MNTPVQRGSNRPHGTLSRREFIKASATLLGAVAIGPAFGAANPEPPAAAKKIVVGAHPWVYAAKRPGNDILPILPSIFEDLAYAGFDGIELMHLTLRANEAVDRITELKQKHQLAVIGSSFAGAMWDRTQHQAVLDDAELILPRLAKLGGRTLGTSVGPSPKPKTEQQLDDQAELLRKLIALCQKHGVVLNLHNHTYEIANNLQDLKGTLARIPDAKLGPDLGWLARGGVDPVGFIRQYGKQIVFLHIRDYKKETGWSEAVGEGTMDYPNIGAALQQVGFQGDAVVELAHERNFQPSRSIRESLKLSRACVKKDLGY